MIEFADRKFKIWGYTISHRGLLLRSEQKYVDADDYKEEYGFNIDIEFGTVSYIDLPHAIYGLMLRKVTSGFPEKLVRFTKDPDLNVFEITSNSEKYYVVADSYLVGRNKWGSESRISHIGLEHDAILATFRSE